MWPFCYQEKLENGQYDLKKIFFVILAFIPDD